MPPKKEEKGKKGKMSAAVADDLKELSKEQKEEKAQKGKTSVAVADDLKAMSKEQLWEEALRLQEELRTLRKEKLHFRQQRNKAIVSWEISKRKLAEEDAKLMNKQRAREAAKERHRAEINEYKQKLKHTLSEHHDTASGLKMDAGASTSLIQNQNTELEIGLQEELHDLEKDSMEKKLQNQKLIEELKLKHQLELMEMDNYYKKKVREMEVEYHEKWESMSKEAAKKRRAEIQELDGKMKSHIKDLMEEHNKSLSEAKKYYQEMKAQHSVMESYIFKIKKQKKKNTKIKETKEEIKRLREELQKEEQKRTELQNQLKEMKRARGQAAMKRTPVKVIEKEKREMLVKHELLLQACEKVEQERDDMLKKQDKAIIEIQRKSGLKDLLLEKKIAAQTEVLEKTQAQLYAVLAAQGDSSAAAKLEELMDSKRAQMKVADDALAQECKKYDYVREIVKEKLTALGVPLFNIPLKTSAQILRGLPPR